MFRYKVKIHNKLHIRLDFDTKLVVVKKESARNKTYFIISEVKHLSSYDY